MSTLVIPVILLFSDLRQFPIVRCMFCFRSLLCIVPFYVSVVLLLSLVSLMSELYAGRQDVAIVQGQQP
jgi:hypothetical protein